MPAENAKLKPPRPCPICGKPSVAAHHPFCSARCQDVDLNRWLSGAYRVETDEQPQTSHPAENDDD